MLKLDPKVLTGHVGEYLSFITWHLIFVFFLFFPKRKRIYDWSARLWILGIVVPHEPL